LLLIIDLTGAFEKVPGDLKRAFYKPGSGSVMEK
jgi:hypothetical protein